MSEEIKDVVENQPSEEVVNNEEVVSEKPVVTEDERIEAIIKRREAKLTERLEAKYESNRKAEADKKTEEARLAELDDATRLKERETAFNLREARLDAYEELTSNGLTPTQNIANMVADINKDIRVGRIEDLKNYIVSEVEKGIKSTLANSPKQVIASTTNKNKDPLAWDNNKGNKESWRK